MSKDEALRLALEALENSEYGDYDRKELNKAITAIKATLEAKDEPADERPCHVFNVTKTGSLTEWEPTTMVFALPDGKHALYTTPPQRTWVGLTDEEINSVRYKRDWTAPWTDTTFARAIEAKLKEKNAE